ncbi:S8 family serine peptidase [Brevifollis gellanilyticus]|uniref:Peptidase S8/S53 domain-containing protein n=1 Tax=Brevifollis gellanilyticus TaxID=748831 RepID=A0A512MGZ3_9BACT|nr:S8 family serine peptidase [Brevifollis gellanilyticus]GEP45994.1 hypothetical protein BGE01nite_52850 [Brevifollis gellanilyticus]
MKILPARPGEGQLPWEEIAKQPPTAISLSPFQERLLKQATMIEQRQFDPRGAEPAREVKLWRTSFKYPLVREEVWLRTDAQGRKLPVRREFSVADHVMVQFPEDATSEQIKTWTERHRLHVRHALKTAPVYLIAADNGSLSTADSIMASFKQTFPTAPQQNGVAERDYLVFPSLFPNDTSFSQLWGLNNTGQTGGSVDADIDAPEAWDITTGSREVVVGVIDTGVDRTHPDLAANMWTNPHEIPGNNVDDDNNGFVDDLYGWDFFSNDNDPMDEEGHGTHCSGTIGGVGSNLTGVTGVCWQVSIVALRFLGPNGGSTSDAMEAVNYAQELGIDLTSNSWGGGGFSSLLQTAIANAGAAGQLFIAAAGNDGTNTDLTANYPSGYAVDTIVSVASSTSLDSRSSFSNYGATTVDLAAPGSAIYSTIPGSSYATYNGTSMATPHVSGAVALLKSVAPSMSAAEIKSRLLSTVDPLSAFTSTTVSRGRLNVARLIEQSAGPRPVVTVTTIEESGGNGDGINNPGETLALRFTVANRGTQAAQNVTATLSSLSTSSQFTITEGAVSLGTLNSAESVVSSTPFRVQSRGNVATPYAEEFAITLRHGSPVQTSEYRVSLYLHTSARLEGRVTDAGTGSPLPAATVRVNGTATFTTTTDADGRYGLTVTDGVYQVTASAPGYVTSSPAQLSTPPGRSGLNFALGIPQLTLSPPVLSETVYSGRSSTRTVEIRNRGSAPLTWSLDLANSQAAASTQGTVTLPEVQVPVQQDVPDIGLTAAFKSQETRILPAVNAPMGALTGTRIGAVSTSWDRSVLISDLQSRGAVVVTITLPFTETALANIDALIIDDAIAALNNNDVTLLRERISSGMGFLSEGDNVTSMTRINQVFAQTGITAAATSGFGDMTFTDIRPHPITTGVTSLREVAVGAAADVTGTAQILVGDGTGLAHAAVSTLGVGTMVFIGNEISDSSNYASGDARLLANQIINELVSNPDWLSVNTTSGVLLPDATRTLTFRFDSGDLGTGTYYATALFTTNIPGESESRLPVTMNVLDAPRISVEPMSMTFGSVVQDVPAQRSVRVRNIGRGTLRIQSVDIQGTDSVFFTRASPGSFDVPAGGFSDVYLDMALAVPMRALRAELVIACDDPVQPTLRLPVSGARQLPPDAVASPASILVQARQGLTGSANVTLENKGTGPLSWRASLGFRPDQPGTPPTWVSVPGVSGDFMPKVKGLIRLNFDTGSLPPGDVTTTLYITTNDVDTPEFAIPVTLRVIAAPKPVLARTGTFPTTIVGQFSRITLPVQNTGAASFQLSTPVVLGTSMRLISKMPFIVLPGETKPLELEFRPIKPGPVTTRISFFTNGAEKTIYITCTGSGITGGKLAVTPASVAVSTAPGIPVSRSLKIANSGQLPVDWSAAIEGAQASFFAVEGADAGTVPGVSNVMLTIRPQTVNTAAGTYRAKLVITNTTTIKPRIEVPLALTVSKAARLEVSPVSPLTISKAWTNTPQDTSLTLRNDGNQPLSILSIMPAAPRLSLPAPPAVPYTLEPGAHLTLPVRMTSTTAGDFTDELVINTSSAAQRAVKVKVVSHVVLPPAITVSPASFDESLRPGETENHDVTLTNPGGDTLHWTATVRDVLGPAATLPNLLTQLESSQVSLTAILPNVHPLTEGVTGSIISDGGAGMFSAGNILSTNLASGATLRYSDNSIINQPGAGPAGTYFTRKLGPLWVFAADLDGATRFTINGGLGAGGAGTAAGGTITRTIAGVTYRAFFKRVSGTSRPSVNHLIIVEDKPGLDHQFAAGTGSDFHEVTGLSGRTRVYYLLFGLQNGAVYADSTFALLMDTFLRRTVHPTTAAWLTAGSPTGTVGAGATSALSMQMDATQLSGGIYSATLRLTSDAPARPLVDVPLILRVSTESRLLASPSTLKFPDTLLGSSSMLSCLVSNPGNLPLTITSVDTDNEFYTASFPFPITLQPRQALTATVRFTPLNTGDHPANLIFLSNATGASETRVSITGMSLRGAVLDVSPPSFNLTVDPGVTTTETFTLHNSGGSPLQWTVTPTSGVASILSLPVSSGSVPAGESRQISLQISTTASTAAGTYTGSLDFSSNDPTSPTRSIPLTVVVPPRPRMAVIPSFVDFGNVFNGGSGSLTVQLRNNGNALLSISSITSDNPVFDYPAQTLPLTVGPGSNLNFTVRFRPGVLGAHSGKMRFTSAASTPVEVTLNMAGSSVAPPSISIEPGQLSATLQQGSAQSLPLVVSNQGGATLTWQTQIVNPSTPTGTLQDVLQRFNASHSSLIGLVPDLFLFTEGVTGTSILDGGNDMYDGGNYLNTSLGSAVAYSDNVVTTNTKLGVGGTYFTRKLPGLFVFVADLNNVSSFFTSGNLGTDGAGSVSGSTLSRTFAGRNYTGFLKSVSGTTDPSVNHLVIVETKSGINHSYSPSTDEDGHSISGLTGTTRLYYLLFAREDGRVVSDGLAGTIMDAFLQSVVLPPSVPWISASPAAGNTNVNGTTTASVQLNAAPLTTGTYTAAVRFTSNAVANSTLDVPVTLTVTPAALTAGPQAVDALLLTDGRTTTRTITLTAREGTNPSWTAAATVPWISLSKTSGTGSDTLTLTLASGTQSAGTYSGAVNITYDGITLSVPVNLILRDDVFTRLLPDYRQPGRILGLVQSTTTLPALLVALDATTLAMQTSLVLPSSISDVDVTTDGRRLYALSYASQSITEVDLDTFLITRTQPVPPSISLGSSSQIRTGRSDRLYYTDSLAAPALHVYDFASAINLYTFTFNGNVGIDGFEVSADGSLVFARSKGAIGSPVFLARLNSSGDVLSQTQTSAAVLTQTAGISPVFFTASRDAVYTQNASFAPLLGTTRQYPLQNITAISAYGHALVSGASILNSTTGASVHTLPLAVSVSAFSGAQDALVYYNSSSQQLVRLPLTGIITLPPVTIQPQITDGTMLVTPPDRLDWTGSALAASYDVYLGTDAIAVAAATNSSGGIYRGNTSGVGFSLDSSEFLPGLTYYWRIDIRNHDGSTVKGAVWSFRFPAVTATPDAIDVQSVPGGAPLSVTLAVSAASVATPWTLAENAAWLSPSATSGAGPQNVTLTFNPAALTAGIYTTPITLTSGSDSVQIPVTFRMLGTLNIVKMIADPTLEYLYALHRDPVTSEGWLLWIEPGQSRIAYAVLAGADVLDFAASSLDNRLYALSNSGTTVVGIDRQTRRVINSWTVPTAAAGIFNGPVGRVVLRTPTNVLQMYHSVTGGTVGSSLAFPANSAIRTSGNGSSLVAAIQQSSTVVGLARYALSTGAITYSTTQSFAGTYNSTFALSGDGTRAFFLNRVYDTSTLGELLNLGSPVLASSWTGHTAWSQSAAISSATGTSLGNLPFTTTIMAATANHAWLVLYHPVNKTLTYQNPAAFLASPSPVSFGSITANQPAYRTITLHNLTSQDLTFTASSNSTDFSVPSFPITVNASLTALVDVTAILPASSTRSATITLTCSQPQWNRTVNVSATTNVSGSSVAMAFDENEPASQPKHGFSFDINTDGKPDIFIDPESVPSTANGLTTHRFSGTISPGFDLSRLGVQASPVEGLWSDLTPELDFTVETSATDKETAPRAFRVMIPASSADTWRFRFYMR